jgi:hypothetical protein
MQENERQMAVLLAALARRGTEALKLYDPLPKADLFHQSRKHERIVSGPNRSSKTLASSVEVARALTGQDPYGKYPKPPIKWLDVGRDLRHIGLTMYPLLFKPGAFRIIRDEATGLWRTYRPWTDKARESEAEPAPPLIPERLVNRRRIGWHDKRRQIPSIINLRNSSQIVFAASTGKPGKGFAVHGVRFDEELDEGGWYEEVAARLVDHLGVFIWSVTPEEGTEQYWRLHERVVSGDPNIEQFEMKLEENPYIEQEAKERFEAKLSAETAQVKIHGKPAMEGFMIFPDFNEGVHCCGAFDVPDTWTRFMLVDPGHQVCGIVFAAVPPDDDESRKVYGDSVYFYDELYLRRCSATIFGESVRDRVCVKDGEKWIQTKHFYVFFIDGQSAKTHDIGSGLKVNEQYADALREYGIQSEMNGSGFTFGSTDTDGGIESVRKWLEIRADGTSKLRIMKDRCPKLVWETKNYRWKRKKKDDGTVGPDKKPRDGNDHAFWGLRVLASFGPMYQRPKPVVELEPVEQLWRAKQKRKREKYGSGFVNLGPPISA